MALENSDNGNYGVTMQPSISIRSNGIHCMEECVMREWMQMFALYLHSTGYSIKLNCNVLNRAGVQVCTTDSEERSTS